VDTCIELDARADGVEAGLAVVGRESAAVALARTDTGCRVLYRQNHGVVPIALLPEPRARFRLRVRDGGACSFSFACGDGGETAVPNLFQAQPGVWIGAKVGLYSLRTPTAPGGHADVDYFRFSPPAH
jgi:hypothetical protein